MNSFSNDFEHYTNQQEYFLEKCSEKEVLNALQTLDVSISRAKQRLETQIKPATQLLKHLEQLQTELDNALLTSLEKNQKHDRQRELQTQLKHRYQHLTQQVEQLVETMAPATTILTELAAKAEAEANRFKAQQ